MKQDFHVEKWSVEYAALLIIDVQNDYCHPRGLMAQRGFAVDDIPPMIPRLRALAETAREVGVPVIWIQTNHDDTTNTGTWLARRSPGFQTDAPPPSNCKTGTWGALPYQLEPAPGDPIVIKYRYSAFADTSLEWVLRGLRRVSLLITGVSTEACVESTLRHGFFRDYHVNLVEDCCASYSREAHLGTVRNVRNLFGLVPTSEQVMAQWTAEREL